MNVSQILESAKVSADVADNIKIFDILCDELCVLTDEENVFFMAEDELPEAALSLKKVELLEAFESKARYVFQLIKEEISEEAGLQAYFIEKVQLLQDKLRVNTSLQLHVMTAAHKKLMAREGGEICH